MDLNGDRCDYRADNLQYVTPAENVKRARLLRILRSIGRDPKEMSREELLDIFKKYEIISPDQQIEEELSNPIQFHLLND